MKTLVSSRLPVPWPTPRWCGMFWSIVTACRQPETLLLTNESAVQLAHEAERLLGQLNSDAKLIVYFIGHAWQGPEGGVFLAAKDTNAAHLAETAVPLQWLVDEMEKCPAKEKLLLLDGCWASTKAEAAVEPSSEEMLYTLKSSPQHPPLRTVTAMASCRAGQRGLVDPKRGHGVFAWSLAEGFSGKADQKAAGRVDPAELFEFLCESMNAVSAPLGAEQAPQLFVPDHEPPPRITAEAKQAIGALAALLRHNRVDMDEANEQYRTAAELAEGQPEPKILFGLLLLLKGKDRAAALKYFEDLKTKCPDLPLPWQGTAWLRFEGRNYKAGVEELVALAAKIPKPERGAFSTKKSQETAQWMGQLREFAAAAVPEAERPPSSLLESLDGAMTGCGEAIAEHYQQGRAQTHAIVKHFHSDLEAADTAAAALKIKTEQRQLAHYAVFPFTPIAERCLAALDR